jgi:pilus assembly protein Flp/PilA
MTILKKLWNDEAGASAAEYALILAIVGFGIVAGALTLSSAIGGAMSDAATCISSASVQNCQ